MTGPAVVHTSTRIVTKPPAADLEWWADTDGDLHAFPRQNGFPPPAVCGKRWNVRHGRQGGRYCPDCLTGIREQLRVLTAALAATAAEDQLGDHFAYPDVIDPRDGGRNER